MEHAVSVLKALYIIFIGKNQCLYEESECDFYFRSLIVALYCIMRFFVFLCYLYSCCASLLGFSAKKTHIHHNIAVIHIFPNTVKHELAEDDPFNTNKSLRMTNQVLES